MSGMSWNAWPAPYPLGSYGVMYHPYIDPAGERSPFVCSSARAQFTGLSIQHGRHVMLRAVYEGVALSLLDCYDTMGVPVDRAAPGRRRRPQPALGADSRRRPGLPRRRGRRPGIRGQGRRHQCRRRCGRLRVATPTAWPAPCAPPATLRPILPGVKITPSSYRSIAACVTPCSPSGSSAHGCYSVSQKAFESNDRALARRRDRRQFCRHPAV